MINRENLQKKYDEYRQTAEQHALKAEEYKELTWLNRGAALALEELLQLVDGAQPEQPTTRDEEAGAPPASDEEEQL